MAQIIGGLGAGNNAVASLAMVLADSDPKDRVEYIGYVETASGVGFLLGPLWGSAMFHIGGYPGPFKFSGKFDRTLS